MKVFVIGAHGHIGHKVTVKLAQNHVQVIAGMRKTAEFGSLPQSKFITPIKFDLTQSIQTMQHVFETHSIDAVIFSAGAGGGVPPETTLKVDLDGAVKSIRAAKNAKVKRYEMVSAAGSNDRKVWNVKFGDFPMYTYYLAKHYADLYLQNSGLNYTILHPVALSNHPGTGKIQLNPNNATQTSIPREDVAEVLVTILNRTKTFKRHYTLASGSTSIQNCF